jgi:hypothetical protein
LRGSGNGLPALIIPNDRYQIAESGGFRSLDCDIGATVAVLYVMMAPKRLKRQQLLLFLACL